MEQQFPYTKHSTSGNSLAWQFHGKLKIFIHSTDGPLCKDYVMHFCNGLLEQDASHQHVYEAHCAYILASVCKPSGSPACESRQSWDCNLECKLVDCHKENKDLRHQVRRYYTELDKMHHRE